MLCTLPSNIKICNYLQGREKEGVGFTPIPTITQYGDMLYCDLLIIKHYFLLPFSSFFFGKLKSLINQNYMSTGASSKNKSNIESQALIKAPLPNTRNMRTKPQNRAERKTVTAANTLGVMFPIQPQAHVAPSP